MFGDMECSTKDHQTKTFKGELLSGKQVFQTKCTGYADGHHEIMERPCTGALVHPHLDGSFYKKGEKMDC